MMRIFDIMRPTDEQKVSFATFMLTDDALNWWEDTKRLMTTPTQGAQDTTPIKVTWAMFEKAFDEQYFPQSYQYEKKQEFMELS